MAGIKPWHCNRRKTQTYSPASTKPKAPGFCLRTSPAPPKKKNCSLAPLHPTAAIILRALIRMAPRGLRNGARIVSQKINFLRPLQRDHAFDVVGVREEVHRLDLAQLVTSVRAQELRVAREAGGIATDVHDAARGEAAQFLDQLGVQADAGRVHHDHAGLEVGGQAAHGLRKMLQIELQKTHAVQSVGAGIALGIGDGAGLHLRAHDAPAGPGQEQRDGAGAAIEIINDFVGLRLGARDGLAVEHLGLTAVGLEKRAGRNFEREPVQRFPDETRPVQREILIAAGTVFLRLVTPFTNVVSRKPKAAFNSSSKPAINVGSWVDVTRYTMNSPVPAACRTTRLRRKPVCVCVL